MSLFKLSCVCIGITYRMIFSLQQGLMLLLPPLLNNDLP